MPPLFLDPQSSLALFHGVLTITVANDRCFISSSSRANGCTNKSKKKNGDMPKWSVARRLWLVPLITWLLACLASFHQPSGSPCVICPGCEHDPRTSGELTRDVKYAKQQVIKLRTSHNRAILCTYWYLDVLYFFVHPISCEDAKKDWEFFTVKTTSRWKRAGGYREYKNSSGTKPGPWRSPT